MRKSKVKKSNWLVKDLDPEELEYEKKQALDAANWELTLHVKIVKRYPGGVYDIYDAKNANWIVTRAHPDNVLSVLAKEACIVDEFIDEEIVANETQTRNR